MQRRAPGTRVKSNLLIHKPILKAYSFSLLYSLGPRYLSILILVARRKLSLQEALKEIRFLFRNQHEIDRLPIAFTTLVGGASLLPIPLARIFPRVSKDSLRFIAALVGAGLGFTLLNNRETPEKHFRRASLLEHDDHANTEMLEFSKRSGFSLGTRGAIRRDPVPPRGVPLAGTTMDLTFFAVVRAVDIGIGTLWLDFKKRRIAKQYPRSVSFVAKTTAPAVFAISCSLIMWSWFYKPHRLPPSYDRWISTAAKVDPRLVEALRQCRYGSFVYGKDTGMAPLLASMCRDLGYPEVWGDPVVTIPVPCELVHMGLTKSSCEGHALARFAKTFLFALRMYLPLNFLFMLRRPLRRCLSSKQYFRQVALGSIQSSSFLAMFVMLFYYGVCLARNRVGPKLVKGDPPSLTKLDAGICVGTGCSLCGWSILLEKPNRRPEFAHFVAPRALSTLFPRRYNRKYLRIEHCAFALSTALILTTAQSEPTRVRGVFGRLVSQIFR